jgi:L-seryl-tRNA(Ser) seleniumtransferase
VEAVDNPLRSLPAIDQLLRLPAVAGWIEEFGRPLALEALRASLDEAREQYPYTHRVPDQSALLGSVEERLLNWATPPLLPVINASGVVLHTNLGRAPLSAASLQAAQDVSLGYSNLEYDLEQGQRGSRLMHAGDLLKRLCGVEAALVVNNNAAAVLLVLTALARRRIAVIARSQLVEIGGGFRVPDVMKQSGARLLEVGTTNRVHLGDYETALQENPALFLHVHRSNFRISGFTSEPELSDIAALAKAAAIALVDDQGSGALLDTQRFGLGHEPMVQESLAAGADLVCFSGDKLLGGPQAGIIVGRAALVDRLKKHPLARALRADKLCLAALSATLLHYVKDEAEREIPIWRMIAAPLDGIERRAHAWESSLGQGQVIPGESTVGGGSLPGETLPTHLLALDVASPVRILKRFRQGRVPVIARMQDERIVLDPRTVLAEQENLMLDIMREVLTQ